ncbi:polysaccharide biosynthesis protein [Synechococcus sp. CS-1324]|nr:polysaccharide biosynthesis protein [Synechococcus sp. CS-1324]PZV04900.1 MAG: polysaccharide biosynthesis protein [Cyanobium sp.]
MDGLLIACSFIGAYLIRFNQDFRLFISYFSHHGWLLPWAVGSGLLLLAISGWYRSLTRYSGSHSLYALLPRAAILTVGLWLIAWLNRGVMPPNSFWFLYFLLFTIGSIGSRIILRDLLRFQLGRVQPADQFRRTARRIPTLIYGAGRPGASLRQALQNDRRFKLIAFLDDDPRLQGRKLQGLTIHSPEKIRSLVEKHQIKQTLLAISTLSRHRKRELVDRLTECGLSVLTIPSLAQLASAEIVVDELRAVTIEDLLGREASSPDPELLGVGVTGASVLVTGAGGSIGTELCLQIHQLGARTLVMLEQTEFSLYSLEKVVSAQHQPGSELVPVLGDAGNKVHLEALCKRYAVDTIFHAAAYKHVPIVESNLCVGIGNNLRCTASVIDAALHTAVKRVVLISTDKAVRPTSAMGASKRVCELMIQNAAQQVAGSGQGPIFSMVRFGNVLASSGSVIPLFHQQIQAGGPITVTHPAITRYFMTIPEAVQLVLQSTGMAEGGDLFLLDMGEPVRIADLARQMVELSGLRVRDQQHPGGDIEIQFTGLRPGEKLFEELLINPMDQETRHPLIRRAREPQHASRDLAIKLDHLNRELNDWNDQGVISSLQQLVPEYLAEGKEAESQSANLGQGSEQMIDNKYTKTKN